MGLNAPQRLWNDDDRKIVAGMLLGGATASQVGKALDISRNAAIGRISRDPFLHPLMRSGGSTTIHHRPAWRATPRPPTEPVPPDPEPEPDEQLMPLIATGNTRCKWPVRADAMALGGVLCCGRPVKPDQVYCEQHRQKARRLS